MSGTRIGEIGILKVVDLGETNAKRFNERNMILPKVQTYTNVQRKRFGRAFGSIAVYLAGLHGNDDRGVTERVKSANRGVTGPFQDSFRFI